ncbi:hypothetical protein [Cohnella lupini]|uniref:Glycosyl transferase family 2 n=1 Tax=Cohnella lupini TaxID=1294267 RepID=A0A3D9I7J8_9BACL|nr:hypothetical protein [Cohnella lupini]RED57615.1 hypothetical protein DFP95_11088 [Cohnella lupini]
MIPDLLWILAFYAVAAVFAHWIIRRRSKEDHHHYVLVAGNHQMQIEGYIRALQQFSRRTGTEIGITVVLDQSTDDTGKIMERFARTDTGIEWVRRTGATEAPTESDAAEGLEVGNSAPRSESVRNGNGKVVWVELNRMDDVMRLPL